MHTLDEIMAVAPAVDDADGAGVADVALGKTYWGLSSGAWGTQTGTAAPAPAQKTGQTTPYTSGDDGSLEAGASWPSPRFADNSNGTVTDNLTGLIWLKNANCFGERTWTQALTDANTLNSGECSLSDGSGEGDWRLPNVQELQSLIDYENYQPALPDGYDSFFTGVQTTKHYWSSTTSQHDTNKAWYVGINYGHIRNQSKTSTPYPVWPVRGGG